MFVQLIKDQKFLVLMNSTYKPVTQHACQFSQVQHLICFLLLNVQLKIGFKRFENHSVFIDISHSGPTFFWKRGLYMHCCDSIYLFLCLSMCCSQRSVQSSSINLTPLSTDPLSAQSECVYKAITIDEVCFIQQLQVTE